MGSPSVSLSYGARREVLAQIALRYQEATGAQKMLLLDRVVEVTGYARKYAICLLNHLPVRDWSRRMNDPFQGEWEQIHVYVQSRPMASAGEIFREWQRRFPERFVEAHLSLLQRRLREMRASLAVSQAEPDGGQRDAATASHASSEPPRREEIGPVAGAPTLALSGPATVLSSLPPTSEEEGMTASYLAISGGTMKRNFHDIARGCYKLYCTKEASR
jgi:hypothetical protein